MTKQEFKLLSDLDKARYLESRLSELPTKRQEHLKYWINAAKQGVKQQPAPDLRKTGSVLNRWFIGEFKN